MTNAAPEATIRLPTPLSSQSGERKHKQAGPTAWKVTTSVSQKCITEELRLEGYLPAMLVDGSAVRRIDAAAVPVDPLHQPMVAGPSDRVQP